MPVFLQALVQTDQAHVARILGYEGLLTFDVFLVLNLCIRLIAQLSSPDAVGLGLVDYLHLSFTQL